jgi:lipopolysaccharide export LptBFGC system permease protein LptF
MAARGLRLITYLWRLELQRFAAAFALLLGVYVLIDAVESASAARLALGRIATAYPLKLPLVAAHVAALACTLGTLLTLGVLRRRGEWDAAAAAGISPLKMIVGLAAVPLVVALISLPLVHALAPRSMARYEAMTAGITPAAAADAWWSRDGERLSKWREEGGAPRERVAIERDGDGRAIRWRGACGPERECAWSRAGGWGDGGVGAMPARGGEAAPKRVPAPGAYGFVGGSLASAELSALSADLERQGQSASALRAELSLRTALAVGAFVVPVLALAFALVLGASRATRLVALGLLVGAAYWLTLAAAWNGAAAGALPAAWVSLGVPCAFAAVAAGVGIGAAATRRR